MYSFRIDCKETNDCLCLLYLLLYKNKYRRHMLERLTKKEKERHIMD